MGLISNLIGKILDAVDAPDEVRSSVETVPGTLRPIKREKADKDAPNWYVGKIIDDGNVKCEVISCEENDFRIKILEINWERLGTYMDLGTVYPLRLCYTGRGMQTWEVDPEQMKRDTSQVILQWEEQLGWTWDLDS
jgi:hypothetical protein